MFTSLCSHCVVDYSKLGDYKDEYSDTGCPMHMFSYLYFDIALNCLLVFNGLFHLCDMPAGNHCSCKTCMHQDEYPAQEYNYQDSP